MIVAIAGRARGAYTLAEDVKALIRRVYARHSD